MELQKTQNPINMNFQNQTAPSQSAQVAIASQGEIARVHGQLVAAKNFPRDERRAVDRMLTAFQRSSLAEVSLYQYARGGTNICDLSIRAAEAIAQAWGNLDYGFRELDQKHGESTVEAYCWDLETNTRRSIAFTVQHVRDTKRGRITLEDARDIYEMTANQASRRVRACVLAQIPRDILDSIREQIQHTLKANANISTESLLKMVELFGAYGVNKEMLEGRIQRRLEMIEPAQMIMLRNIYNSLKDGMSAPSDWFDLNPAVTVEISNKSGNQKTADALNNRQPEPPTETQPSAKSDETLEGSLL